MKYIYTTKNICITIWNYTIILLMDNIIYVGRVLCLTSMHVYYIKTVGYRLFMIPMCCCFYCMQTNVHVLYTYLPTVCSFFIQLSFHRTADAHKCGNRLHVYNFSMHAWVRVCLNVSVSVYTRLFTNLYDCIKYINRVAASRTSQKLSDLWKSDNTGLRHPIYCSWFSNVFVLKRVCFSYTNCVLL